jgi:hypothetical protein
MDIVALRNTKRKNVTQESRLLNANIFLAWRRDGAPSYVDSFRKRHVRTDSENGQACRYYLSSVAFRLAFQFISLERPFLGRGIWERNHMRVSNLELAKAQIRVISLERPFLSRGIWERNHMRVSNLEWAKAQIRVVLIALRIP